ncbi:MAG: squalene--hopene cyclase [Prevotellaceae bacterium]|jgi:squalene-hopene/tetraprenyl-beta-curcumene cyclase|nr:squalene--hopene cyclase [Prevotellaceae bacterium]
MITPENEGIQANREVDEIIASLSEHLRHRRSYKTGMWEGQLSSSAISTSVSLFALHIKDSKRYEYYVERAATWLIADMKTDGSWGDTPESPSNLTATLLSYASLYAIGRAPSATERYLAAHFGGTTDQHIIKGVLAYYGTDLTFSVPILVMCALAGIIHSWDKIPQLPFEASVLPQGLFRFLRLPVVSYAIPALIAVGILRYHKGKKGILSPLRRQFIKPALRVLEELQPKNGGFLEAAPLTAFVAMCLSAAGYGELMVTARCADFLVDTRRLDNSWPIDTNLSCWVTSLCARALADEEELPDRELLIQTIKQNAFTRKHPFTGAAPGGWGWTNRPGSVPDADDTAGSLVALHLLTHGAPCPEIEHGIRWLLGLQNADGGMPTFCKGWGKLPFDRSSADISAHALLAFRLWIPLLPETLQQQIRRSSRRLLRWTQRAQSANGSWTPLWFGDQNAADERSPVYGTATVVTYLADDHDAIARAMSAHGIAYLLTAQNPDGGWGGAVGVPSKVTLTARALCALAASLKMGTHVSLPHTELSDAMERACAYLCLMYRTGKLFNPEPIGLYFSRLWYSEELYNVAFALEALKKYRSVLSPFSANLSF